MLSSTLGEENLLKFRWLEFEFDFRMRLSKALKWALLNWLPTSHSDNRLEVAAIWSTWSKVGDVLVKAVDERYNLANTSSTFRRPPQSSREPYLKNELFDKTKLKNARFIKFIFFYFSILGELTSFLNIVLIIQRKKLNYVKLFLYNYFLQYVPVKINPISGSSQE